MTQTFSAAATPFHADGWFSEEGCSLDAFARQIAQDAPFALRFATQVQAGIPFYDCADLGSRLGAVEPRIALQREWARVLADGAGVLVLRRAFADLDTLDEVTAAFESIIRSEREAGTSRADHFAKAGANDRIWNAQEKLCVAAPDCFVRYFANPVLMAISEAWLGPAYQMTSQVNVVRPGGATQQSHRDYHLGFQRAQEAARYPAHVHLMSAYLTLQGAVAHSDMPVASGPTKLLPGSQRYAAGYLAWHRPDFRDYFDAHFVQTPLEKGDAVFFNPALFHAAGANRTDHVQRMANLLQISSAFGRAMETVDRRRMCEAVYPALRAQIVAGRLDERAVAAVVAACAEGYPFPTNLDRDPPVDGMAPRSQQAILHQALLENWPDATLASTLDDHAARRAVT